MTAEASHLEPRLAEIACLVLLYLTRSMLKSKEISNNNEK